MSLDSVRTWLSVHAPDLRVIEVDQTTATVDTAAAALGVEPGRIAKTLAVHAAGHLFLLVTRGNARLDNRKTKEAFGARPRMLGPNETLELTGHPVGGVCPFGLKYPMAVYLDISLKAFDLVYPAGGSLNTSVEVPTGRLATWSPIGGSTFAVYPTNRRGLSCSLKVSAIGQDVPMIRELTMAAIAGDV